MPEAEIVDIAELRENQALRIRESYARKSGEAEVIKVIDLRWYEVEGDYFTKCIRDTEIRKYLARDTREARNIAEKDGLHELNGIRLLLKK